MKKLIVIVLVGILTQVPVWADDISSDVVVKINAILEKQDKILKELAEIKSELNVVKVRTTLNG